MPLLTPSRLVVAILSVFLFSFLWTFGLPQRGYSPPLPVIGHDISPETPLSGPLIPDQPTKVEAPAEEEKKPVVGPALTEEEGSGERKRPGSTAPTAFCREVRGAQDTMVIVKTSKAEMPDKLPPHLATLLACVPNVAIFSDHAGTVNGHTVYDALDTVNATLRDKYDEFREYAKMQANGGYAPSSEKAEKLDKWKYLPMVYKTHKMKPSLRYYLFIETDTTLSWTNLLQWLERLDYRIPYYSGAPMFRGPTKYAQRGSGILLSFGAMRLYAKAYEERYAQQWESHIGGECCGDIILSTAMTASHVEFTGSFPMLQSEAPGTLDWTERHWCTPIVSWHGMKGQETETLWDSQQKWTKKHGWEVPYLARNAFEEFVLPQLVEKKDDWDNVSSDTKIKGEPGRREKLAAEKPKDKSAGQPKPATPDSPHPQPPSQAEGPSPKPNLGKPSSDAPPAPKPARRGLYEKIGATIKDAADSAANCQAVCQKTEDCIQWKYSAAGDGECHLGKVLRLGRKVEKEEEKGIWTSGWMLDRVRQVTNKWGKCERPNWKFNQ
ncbi:glycosyltransferase family 31 protein [Lentithecium fluviatile CBS 122367]|uniref:Glycosyltransferase family 31 protein n=1 Tax=Lentithecium fluviatile CBS 122367 TaxID=1168545 RepID=A0A6G1IS91_9PLEO|nr:glycosyltransferase family 31 protein [Lentithecium fluviatile CBS 122367]